MEQLRYLDEREVSKITGISIQTLRNDRFKQRGIPYCKPVGRRLVRYRLSDIIRFMESNVVETSPK
ncbi:MAG: helix-turn-helix transcriptional regulator [Desulfobacteraceae bacterium]